MMGIKTTPKIYRKKAFNKLEILTLNTLNVDGTYTSKNYDYEAVDRI